MATALPKPVGAIAAGVGAVTGLATIVGALGQPENTVCIQQLASVFGAHGTEVGAVLIGVITTGASVVAWLSHGPVPLSAKQQAHDAAKQAVG